MRQLHQEGPAFEESEYNAGSDDDDTMSLMSYATINQDKYFIPPDADLDAVMNTLLQKKSKAVIKKE